MTVFELAKHESVRELTSFNQWVVWRRESRKGGGYAKVPYNPRNPAIRASMSDPSTWGTYEEMEMAFLDSEGRVEPWGFVFTEEDPYCGIDLDDSLLLYPRRGLAPRARRIAEKMASYTEISPSGTGVKILVRAKKPGPRCRKGNVEIYDSGRFFALTQEEVNPAIGEDAPNLQGIEERQQELEELYYGLFGEDAISGEERNAGHAQVSLSDASLLDRARRSKNGSLFRRLFDTGDTGGFSSHSEADMALCGILAFWAGRDATRIDRLFRSSALFRPKWDRPTGERTYGEWTIARAITGNERVYGER
jgi:putative DNA primase/helicase